MDGHSLYIEINITSAVVCVLCAFLLVLRNRRVKQIRAWSERAVPHRYVAARTTLAIAYVFIGALTVVRIVMHLPDENDVFLPLNGLVISSSQAMLFTAALLSLYDSHLLRYEVIIGNILPFFLLAMLYSMAWREENGSLQLTLRYVWFALYVLQLIVYTVFFYSERKKYLHMPEKICGESYESRLQHDKWIKVLFPGSLVIGILALASYFFTAEWEMTLFVILYTIFYIAVTIYFLCYETRFGEEWIRKKLRSEE